MILYMYLFSCIVLCVFPKRIGENMYSTIKTAVLEGISALPIQVEADISTGMPMFDMVGNLSSEIREAKGRVKTALHNCGIVLPAKRITINFAPANIKKSGTGFDLPIAIALITSMGIVNSQECEKYLFVGELNLKGDILPVNGILPIVSDGLITGVEKYIVPYDNYNEASLVPGAEIYGFKHFSDVINFLNDGIYEKMEIICKNDENDRKVDFSDVNGQNLMKRACEIAASGMHNMLMIGSPGAGKTMIAERLPTILPPLSDDEKIDLSKIYSVCGLLDNTNALIKERPFRNPHYSITKRALIGGGYPIKPGEISLAHNGVLFLDELVEFTGGLVDSLRKPLEEKIIRLSRGNSNVVFPSDFLFLGAMNPCNCGYYPDMQRCRCSEPTLKRYFEKLSQPMLDRIDICVEAPVLSFEDISECRKNETSDAIRERVVNCQNIQQIRFKDEEFKYNSKIPSGKMNYYCFLDGKEKAYMENMYDKLNLTARTYHKILRVARTIADMDSCDTIKIRHLNEAICYRSINEKYWGGIQ